MSEVLIFSSRSTFRSILAGVVLLGAAVLGVDARAQVSPGAPPPPQGGAANPMCSRLEGQLATIDRGGSGDPAKDDQIRRYQDAVAGVIGRYGGFVAKFMGDGVLAYFGFPSAFEDAAERAVRAAIGILSEVGTIEMPDGARVQARIGIATGLVVVGEIIGTGMAQERTIVGETPNLAARLQALAGTDCILVSESTQKLLGGLFELTHTGEHELKGFARPVPAWQDRKSTRLNSSHESTSRMPSSA